MKKQLTLFICLIMTASLFGFSPVSFVTFKSGLTYEQGEDVQTNTVKRTLKPFSMNKFETTYGLWYKVRVKAESMGYYFQNPGQAGSEGKHGAAPTEENTNQPVTMISWYDAVVWCNAYSEIKERTPCYTFDGQILRDSGDTATLDLCECNWNADGFRLPSEAEWEFAARRTKTKLLPGNLISGLTEEVDAEEGLLYAWISENADATRVVGTAGVPFEPGCIAEPASGNANAAGLYDMSGNVLEFCWDWFDSYSKEIYGPAVGYERVSRGGSWSMYTFFNYTADRYSYDPNEAYDYMGFRFCCTAQ